MADDDDDEKAVLVSRARKKPDDDDEKAVLVSRAKKPEAPQPTSWAGHQKALVDQYLGEAREGFSRATAPNASTWERIKGGGEALGGALGYVQSPFESYGRRLAQAAGGNRWAQEAAGNIGSVLGPGGLERAGTTIAREAPAMARAAGPLISKAATAGGKVLRSGIEAADDLVKAHLERSATGKAIEAENAAPTQKAINDAATEAFDEAKKAGVVVKPETFDSMIDNLPTVLEKNDIKSGDMAISKDVFKYTKKLADRLEDYRGKALTWQQLRVMQIEANAYVKRALIAGKGDTTQDVRGAMIIKNQIKDFVNGLTEEQIQSGDPKKAVEALGKAKELWRRQEKIQTIQDIIDVGTKLKDHSYIQRGFQAILKDPIEYKNFSPAEQKLIDKIAQTGRVETIGRAVAPGLHGASNVAKSIGYAAVGAAHPAALAVGGAGLAAKYAGRASRMKDIKKLIDMIARGEASQTTVATPGFADRINSVLRGNAVQNRMTGRRFGDTP